MSPDKWGAPGQVGEVPVSFSFLILLKNCFIISFGQLSSLSKQKSDYSLFQLDKEYESLMAELSGKTPPPR